MVTLDDVPSLRVVDLKAELKARELPINGLKAELAERLTAALKVWQSSGSGLIQRLARGLCKRHDHASTVVDRLGVLSHRRRRPMQAMKGGFHQRPQQASRQKLRTQQRMAQQQTNQLRQGRPQAAMELPRRKSRLQQQRPRL